jgi:DNA repair exonuclease SbcCD ATPase subunit
MTKDGLERIKSEFDEEEVDDYQTEDGNIDEMEQQLEKLKRDREHLEQDLEKTRAQKVQELEKIDRALEEKKAEKKGAKKEAEMKKTQQIAVGAPTGLSKVAAVAQKAEDLHLLIQRFTY